MIALTNLGNAVFLYISDCNTDTNFQT